MTAPLTRHMMLLADEQVELIRRTIERTHAPVEIIGDGGRRAVFRIRRGKLYGYETTGDTVVCNEVLKQSDMERMVASQEVTRPDPVELEKDEIRHQLRQEHTDMPADVVDMNADIIYEARQTVLRLAQQGVPPHVASQMVTGALKLTDEDRGHLENMIATYQETHNIAPDSSENTVVHVGPPTDPIPARRPVADPMSGEF